MPEDDFDELKKKMAGMTNNGDRIATPITPAGSRSSVLSDSQINPARWTHKRLGAYIRDFEDSLDQDHEVGARLVSFGQAVTFHIEYVGYYGPDIISFDGVNENGEAVQLIQNISQLSVLLVAMRKTGEEPRRIGFLWDDDTDANESK